MKGRNSNIELLRLCSMMMIMVLHFLGHSRYASGNIFSVDTIVWNLMESLCISSTAIFVLISGYFGISFKIKGVLKLYLSCAVWGIVGYLLYCVCANTPPANLMKLFARLMPFTHGKWWFIITYLELYFLSPILNAAIEMFDKRKHMIAIIIFCFVTLYMGYCRETGEDTWGTSLSHFLWLYMIARYINKYVDLHSIRKYRRIWLIVFASSVLVTFVLSIIGIQYSVPLCLRAYPYNSPWNTIAAISALLFALSFSFYNKTINWFASSSLSCYLFQEHLYFGLQVFYPIVGSWLLSLSVFEHYAILFPLAIAFMIPVMLTDKLWSTIIYKPVLKIYDKLYTRFVPLSLRNVF